MISTRPRRAWRAALIVVASALLGLDGGSALAQATSVGARSGAGGVSGLVVDARSGAALPGARIILRPELPAVLPPASSGSGPFMEGVRTTHSDSAGQYHFASVAHGRYHLRIERVGYRPTTVEVELRGNSAARVAVELGPILVRLEQVEVRADAPSPYGRLQGEAIGKQSSSLIATRQLRERNLATDAQALTHQSVLESVTLAESDVLRALQRLPGVSARDDLTAAPWVRGARWDLARLYFDGIPLHNPLHAFGAFSGVNSDAIGGAFLHPGVRPASIGGGAAATIDIRTRTGGSEHTDTSASPNAVNGVGELSIVSARAALDQRLPGDRVAWMLSARRSILDGLTGADSTHGLPYAFSDLTARVDVFLNDSRVLEVSGVLADNHIEGRVFEQPGSQSRRWGTQAARVTLDVPQWGGRARYTIGGSQYSQRSRGIPSDTVNADDWSGTRDARGGVAQPLFSADWTSGGASVHTRSSAGVEFTRYASSYDGPRHRPTAPRTVDSLTVASDIAYATLWGERRWRPMLPFELSTGARVDVGSAVARSGSVRVAPRIVARYDAGHGLFLSAGAGRTYQYEQAVSPSGPFSRSLSSDRYLWLLAGGDVEPVVADIATLGGEYWFGDSWLTSAHVFARRMTGGAVDDPAPGPIADHALYVSGRERAHGVETMVRRLAGRWTTQVAYTYGTATVSAGGYDTPSPEDRRHAVDATTRVALGRWHIGAAYTAAAGAPYTRFFRGTSTCAGASGCRWIEPPRTGVPLAQRLGTWESLDFVVDWSRPVGRWWFGGYLELRNVLGFTNAQTYASSTCRSSCAAGGIVDDDVLTGIPRAQIFGLRASF